MNRENVTKKICEKYAKGFGKTQTQTLQNHNITTASESTSIFIRFSYEKNISFWRYVKPQEHAKLLG